MLHRIRTLYAIERRIRDTPPDQRHRTRQAESVPVLNALRAWLDDTLPKGLPSGPLGKAMRSLDNQWDALVRFCDDGRYGIDTNPVENAIRPFCLGTRRLNPGEVEQRVLPRNIPDYLKLEMRDPSVIPVEMPNKKLNLHPAETVAEMCENPSVLRYMLLSWFQRNGWA